jgi:hypothetical protein
MRIQPAFFFINDIVVVVLDVLVGKFNTDKSACDSDMKFIQASNQYIEIKNWVSQDLASIMVNNQTINEPCRSDDSIMLCEDSVSPFFLQVFQEICESLHGQLVYMRNVTVTCNQHVNSTIKSIYIKIEYIPECVGVSCSQDEIDRFLIDSDPTNCVDSKAASITTIPRESYSSSDKMDDDFSNGLETFLIMSAVVFTSAICCWICPRDKNEAKYIRRQQM